MGPCFYHQRVNVRKSVKELKGEISGLRRFVASECPLEVIQNGLHFALKALFILEIFTFLF